jgi:hypothetical protein
MLKLKITKRTDKELLKRMAIHYSAPKGFVGRNICYAIYYNNIYYGHIVGGSATKHLKNRHKFLGTSDTQLNKIVNNIFYNISKINSKYPKRNFTTFVLKQFMKQIQIDWFEKYNDVVVGFETLVEKPRKGELYKRAGWTKVGETKGYTCKRIGGQGSDSWSGKRVWCTDKNKLRPKNILCYKL